MAGHLRVYAELRGYGARGPRYQVRMNKPDGMVIVNATTEPLFAAARVLLSKGVTGKLQLWDSIRPYCRLQGDIERLAGMTVSEGDAGMCLRRYVERTAGDDFEGDHDVTGRATSERTCTTKHGATMNVLARSAVAA
jgi:hypothetical protein